jgi:hypothetical protein
MVYPFRWTFRVVPAFLACLVLAGLTLQPALPAQTSPSSEAPLAQIPQANDLIVLADHTTVRPVPAKPGDICFQCGHAIGLRDPVYDVNGHRIPLHLAEHERDLPGQLYRLSTRFEPSGAFLQAAARETGLSPFWFLFGCYVLLGLLFAALCAHRALHKGLHPWAWFLAGLFLNLFAFGALLLWPARSLVAVAGVPAGLHKISLTHAPKHCPKCGGENHPAARACAGCGAALHPSLESEVARAGLRSA